MHAHDISPDNKKPKDSAPKKHQRRDIYPPSFLGKLSVLDSTHHISIPTFEKYKPVIELTPLALNPEEVKQLYSQERGAYKISLGKIILNHFIAVQFALLKQPAGIRKKIIELHAAKLMKALRAFCNDNAARYPNDDKMDKDTWEALLAMTIRNGLSKEHDIEKFKTWWSKYALLGVTQMKLDPDAIPSNLFKGALRRFSLAESWKILCIDQLKQGGLVENNFLGFIKLAAEKVLRSAVKKLTENESFSKEEDIVATESFVAVWFELRKTQYQHFKKISTMDYRYPGIGKLLLRMLALLAMLTWLYLNFGLIIACAIAIPLSLFTVFTYTESDYNRMSYSRTVLPAHLEKIGGDLNNQKKILNNIYKGFALQRQKFHYATKDGTHHVGHRFQLFQPQQPVLFSTPVENQPVRGPRPARFKPPKPVYESNKTRIIKENKKEKEEQEKKKSSWNMEWYDNDNLEVTIADPNFLYPVSGPGLSSEDPTLYLYVTPEVIAKVYQLTGVELQSEDLAQLCREGKPKGNNGLVNCNGAYIAETGEECEAAAKMKFKDELAKTRLFAYKAGTDKSHTKTLLVANAAMKTH